jgi:inosine/xanthosine triphosphate pyrophosphatase family protein
MEMAGHRARRCRIEAAGYDLKFVPHGHGRTLEDMLVEQRQPDSDS